MRYQIAILLTNHQVYREACPIFQLENDWTIIWFNKAGVGKEMRDHGFPVAAADNLRRHVKFPVLEVTVEFAGLQGRNQSDILAVATVHLKPLMRALWTAKGASEMEVTIHVQPPRTNKSPSEHCLLRPFLKLRSIKRLVVLGASEQEYVDELARVITTTNGSNQTLRELAAGVRRLQRYTNTEQWVSAFEQAIKFGVLRTDCEIASGERFFGIEPGINTTIAIAQNQVVEEVLLAGTMSGGEITLHTGKWASAISSADRALSLLSRRSTLQHIIPIDPAIVVHPFHQLPSLTGIMTSVNETKCNILLLRARAYIGMQRADDAFQEIQTARDLMPNSVKLASVFQAWKVMFRALPVPPLLLSLLDLD